MPPNVHRLFFAVMPDTAALQAIGRVVEALQAGDAFRGRFLAPAKYHLTVQFLGDHREPAAAALVERASAAAARVDCAPFAVTLDRVITFSGRYQLPCVLRCTHEADQCVLGLWRQLGNALAALGVEGDFDRRFIPHLTIAYADRRLAKSVAIEPVTFAVEQFVLVDSSVGPGTHEVIGRWPLAAEPAPFRPGQNVAPSDHV